MDTTTTTKTIDELMETLEDSVNGFTDAADRLDQSSRPDAATMFRAFAKQRAGYRNELRDLAVGMGHQPKESGTVAGTLHRTWLGLKDALTGDAAGPVLTAAEKGEEHALSEYQKACDETDLPAAVKVTIQRQKTEVAAALAKVQQLQHTA